ncbi:MBL fold metallo-hydrolase [Prochlorothrix hollandica]|uniref:Zn-dependent hydrolase n=1 Tax=Prochlorothrix hollandica PCC 9006 = CALU 1027 TaxID=317619 RepID=A0A0M2PW75_PROHO|nr:MBL fold metallo-hydrolase [Prochlorothrix hollandica]KKI98913.1 Zn-dependent hydrolase [Prochlorothrix hollandica PCC 9006 = CALU 1027]
MKRRQFIHHASAGLVTALGTSWLHHGPAQAQSPDTLTLTWFGHTCVLFSGGGQRVLVNPFQAIGCTAGYPAPQVESNYVLISSRQLDEGAVENLPGTPRIFSEPGAYRLGANNQIQGIRTDHDRLGGKRFGRNVAWRWTQGGLDILHLGGIASEISTSQKILMGSPDVLLIPVGGQQPPAGTSAYDPRWPEVYTPEEAKAAIAVLNPKLVIPTHYRTDAANANACDLVALQDFVQVMGNIPIRYSTDNSITLQGGTLPTSPTLQVLSYSA